MPVRIYNTRGTRDIIGYSSIVDNDRFSFFVDLAFPRSIKNGQRLLLTFQVRDSITDQVSYITFGPIGIDHLGQNIWVGGTTTLSRWGIREQHLNSGVYEVRAIVRLVSGIDGRYGLSELDNRSPLISDPLKIQTFLSSVAVAYP